MGHYVMVHYAMFHLQVLRKRPKFNATTIQQRRLDRIKSWAAHALFPVYRISCPCSRYVGLYEKAVAEDDESAESGVPWLSDAQKMTAGEKVHLLLCFRVDSLAPVALVQWYQQPM